MLLFCLLLTDIDTNTINSVSGFVKNLRFTTEYTSKGLRSQVTQEVISGFFSPRQTFILKPIIRYSLFSIPLRHLKIHTSIQSPRSVSF